MSGIIHIENPELVSGVSGSGTINRLPLWTGISTLGNSALTQLGTLVGVNVAVPTAGLSLPAGTTAEASLNFATGVAPTAPNAGDLWFDGTYLYLRAGGVNQPLNAPYGTGTQDRLSKWGPGGVGLTDSVIVQDNSLGYMNTRVVTTTDTNVFALDSNAGVGRNFTFRSGGLDRFAMRVTGAEGGSDAGGDWSLRRYSDAGASLGQPLTAIRADGRVYTSDNFGAGTDPGTGNAIFSLTNLVGGSGYTASASGVALTGGSGTGATASIIVSGGAVTWVSLESPGQGYQVGDVLAITGGTGTIQVLSTSKVSRVSGLLSVSARIGAGTSQPQAGLDSRLGGTVSGWQRPYVSFGGTGYAIATMLAAAGTEDASVSGSATIVGMAALPISSSLNTPLVVGMYAWPSVNNTSGTGSLSVYGQYTRALRTFSGDTNTNVNLLGTFASIGHASGGPASFTSASWTGLRINCFAQVPGSVIDVYGVRNATSNISNATAITTYRAFAEDAFALSGGATIGTYYGLRLAAITGAVTTRWGISQEDALGKSRFYGNLGVGNALDVGAGKVIASLTLTNAGAGATNGTYSEAALTGGSGTGATADIVVSGNVVTSLVLRNPGQGYVVGDTLSTAAIGGAGFVFTVASTASILRSDGTVVAPRIGAGTATPRGAIDLASGAMIATSLDLVARPSTNVNQFLQRWLTLSVSPVVQITSNLVVEAISSNPRIDISTQPSGLVNAFSASPQLTATTAAQTATVTGYSAAVYRANPNDVSTGSTTVRGFSLAYGALSGVGATSTTTVLGFDSAPFITAVGHTFGTFTHFSANASTFNVASTITNYYGFRQLAPTGVGTITNRWGVSVEDAATKSAFWGNVGVGNALDVGAGKVIASLTLTNAGTGYTNNSYANVALTGGSGTGATADIIVAGNAVTSISLRNPGQGYVVGDVLSCASIGAGANFQVTVATIASILRSDGTVVTGRVAAGVTSPLSAVYARGLIYSVGPEVFENAVTPAFPFISASNISAGTFGEAGGVYTLPSAIGSYYAVQAVPRASFASRSAGTSLIGFYAYPTITSATSAGTSSINSVRAWGAIDTTDAAKTFSITAVNTGVSIVNVGAGCTVSNFWQHLAQLSVFSPTAVAITTATHFEASTSLSGAAHAVTTMYGIRLRTPTLASGSTIATQWGVSQEATAAKNQFLGNTGIGVDPGVGKVIASLTLTNAGTGYTNGTYSQVALTTSTGSGSGATADIVVAGNVVTTVVLRNPGQGYAVGDTLSCASIGAGSNFLLTVATTASILRSDGTVVGTRVGAGNTAPRASLDVQSGAAIFDGADRVVYSQGATLLNEFSRAVVGEAWFQPSTSSNANGIAGFNRIDATSMSGSVSVRGAYLGAITRNSAVAANLQISGGTFLGFRSESTDLSTAAQVYGVVGAAYINTGIGSATTQSAAGLTGQVLNFVAAHTITTATLLGTTFFNSGTVTTLYGLRLSSPLSAGTITNRWGVSQEDTLAKNVLAGSTAIGLAAGTVAAAFLELAAGTTASAQIRFRTGVAPSSPAVGDFWFDGTDFRVRNGAGTQVIAYVGGSGAVSGTGTPNFLPIWNGASSLTDSPLSFSGSTLTTAASLTTIDFSAANQSWRVPNNTFALEIGATGLNPTLKINANLKYLGVNTASSPGAMLHVGDQPYAGAALDGIRLTNGSSSYIAASDGTRTLLMGANGSQVFVGSLTNHTFIIKTNNADAITIDTSQNVGIGTTSPLARMDVSGVSTVNTPIARFAGNNGGGTIQNLANLSIYGNLSGGFVETTLVYGNTVNSYLAIGHHNGTSYTERVRIDASGNLGVAQTSPTSFLSGFRNLVIGNASGGSYGLTIVADPAGSSGIAFADGTAGTEPYRGFIQYLHASDDLVFATTAQEKVRIESNGRVLFGTTSSSAVARAVFQGTSASASAATDVYLQTGTAAASITNNSNLGVLSFAASGSRGAYMQAEADAGWTVSSYPTRLVFATTPSGTTAQSERLRIDSAGSFLLRQSSNPFVNAVSFNTTLQNSLVLDASGNLGVGTGSPAHRIDAQGSGTRVIRCLTTDTSGAAVGLIRAEYLGGGGGANSSIDMRAGDGYAFITTNTGAPIVFGVNGVDIGRFTTTGVLCIGTSSGTAASRLVARTTVGNADQMIASFDNDGATIGATGYRTSIQVSCQNTGAADTAIRLTAKAQGSGGGQTSFVEVGTDAGVDMFFVTKGVQRGYVAANDGSLVMTDSITATAGNITATAGNIVATAGNFVVSTSGKGIDFSATPGTGTSELLDDYEEGVWTPALGTSTVGASFTLTSVDARYTKVGRLVHIQWRIVVSSKTGAPVDVILQGLPFTHDECYVAGLIEAYNLSNTGAATANKFAHVVIWGFPGTTVFNMDLVNIDYVARDVGAQVQAATEFNGSFSYITNS